MKTELKFEMKQILKRIFSVNKQTIHLLDNGKPQEDEAQNFSRNLFC